MKIRSVYSLLLMLSVLSFNAITRANPLELDSISALAFSPNGILFIGDSIKGEVFAIELEEKAVDSVTIPPAILDLEQKIALLVGAKASDILIHDMAVDPLSKNVYLSVSRGRANWNNRWQTPNTLANASMLVKVKLDSSIELVTLSELKHSSAMLPNPIAQNKTFRLASTLPPISKRVEAITKLAYRNGQLFVAGLSNEDFASSMWTFAYPFNRDVKATTLEIFHAAHNRNETHSPIRSFIPYTINEKPHLLAAYLCTPLVTIALDALQDKRHVKGRTIAELGDANIPIDMLAFEYQGEQKIVISHNQLPLMTIKAKDIASQTTQLITQDQIYSLGLNYTALPRGGIQQMDDFNDKFILATKRMAGGKLSLISLKKSWLY